MKRFIKDILYIFRRRRISKDYIENFGFNKVKTDDDVEYKSNNGDEFFSETYECEINSTNYRLLYTNWFVLDRDGINPAKEYRFMRLEKKYSKSITKNWKTTKRKSSKDDFSIVFYGYINSNVEFKRMLTMVNFLENPQYSRWR